MSINLLPEDVLCEIFKYSVPPSVIFSQHYVMKPSYILVLMHVCSHWRRIALSMRFLWSTIFASNLDGVEGTLNLCGRNAEHLMHEWLSRAASAPRTLYLLLGPCNNWQEDLILIDTIQSILASYPFRKLSVTDTREESEALLDLPNQVLEHLEDLNLQWSSVKFPHDVTLSNLQSLFTRGASHSFRRLSVAIPWSQLRHLTLSSLTISSDLLFNVLNQCSYLEYCRIERLTPLDPPTLIPFFNITLPNLQSFEFYLNDCELAMECLRRLAIPSVNTMLLGLLDLDTLVPLQFIERSDGMPLLRTITLSHWDRNKRRILLKQFPLLESITIGSRFLGCSDIREDLSTGRIGPRLKHLFVEGGSSVKASLGLLKNRYHNAMRSTQQHDGQVCQPPITHFQSATFAFYRDKSYLRDMIRDALESDGRSPYRCLRWVSWENRTCTLDDIED